METNNILQARLLIKRLRVCTQSNSLNLSIIHRSIHQAFLQKMLKDEYC